MFILYSINKNYKNQLPVWQQEKLEVVNLDKSDLLYERKLYYVKTSNNKKGNSKGNSNDFDSDKLNDLKRQI